MTLHNCQWHDESTEQNERRKTYVEQNKKFEFKWLTERVPEVVHLQQNESHVSNFNHKEFDVWKRQVTI